MNRYRAQTNAPDPGSYVTLDDQPIAETANLADAQKVAQALNGSEGGRWTIHEMNMGAGWNARVGGPVTDALPVDVVPCDEAAIERAALAVKDAYHHGVQARLLKTLWRDVAEAALRAAGETP